MPDNAADKTEAPTPRRLQDAREKGQVAKSTDLSAAVGLLAGLILLNIYGTSIMKGWMDLLGQILAVDTVAITGKLALDDVWRTFVRYFWSMLAPFFMIMVVIAIAVNLVQVGFIFSGHSLIPSFGKISPIKGFTKIFSRRTAVRMAMSFLKVGIITYIAYLTIKSFLPQMVNLAGLNFLEVIGHGAHLMFVLGLRLAAVLLILALFDYAYQRWQMRQDLRMTKEEVKEEMKRMEGDPVMRQRRRAVARQLAAQRMSQAVPQADVIITNPTELAIALKYDHKEMPAPKVIARGAGYIAERIRAIALEHGVPIIERKPLAQALYKSCEVGDYVPPELYQAVAEVLAYVFELAGKGFRRTVAS